MIRDHVGRHYAPYAVPVPPAGIAYLAGKLVKCGHTVKCLDLYAFPHSDQKLLGLIQSFQPDAVGFSCLTLAMENVSHLYRLFKAEGLNFPVILGNAHVSILARETLEKGIGDVIVKGEAEESISELASALEDGRDLEEIKGIAFRKNGGIVETPPRSPIQPIDSIPFPVWHDFDLSVYRAAALPLTVFRNVRPLPVLATRGCPFTCEFCAQDYAFKGLRKRSLEHVVEEIEYLHRDYGCDCIGFLDACFPLNVSQGMEFCELYRRKGLDRKIIWFCETRVSLVEKELLREMAASGCRMVQYGFESGSQEVLDTIGKETTLEEAENAVEYTREAGILAYGLFMLGNRGETRDTCMETIRFARKLDCDLAKFNLVIPYPGSSIYSRFREEGRMSLVDRDEDPALEDTNRFTGFFDLSRNGSEPLFVPEGMTARELVRLQKKAMFSFYLRPGLISRYFFRRIVAWREMFKGAFILVHDMIRSK